MIAGRTTVYISRISLIKTIQDYDKKSTEELEKMVSQLIKNDEITNQIKSDFEWHFGDIFEDAKTIFCKLGKIKKHKEKTKFDKENKKFIDITTDEEEAFISHLLFDKKNHFLIFEERPEVGYKELMFVISESLKRIFKRDIKIEILPNKIETKRILDEASKIMRAVFSLTPSNPDSAEDLRKMDELVRDVKAKRAKLDFFNEDGLNFKKSIALHSALSLSDRGFGKYSLEYEQDGKVHKYESKRKQMKESIKKSRTNQEWRNKLLDILEKIKSLLDKK